MWLRGHISVFALGSVILLTANLLRGSGGIWADTAIGAWGVLVVAHGIMMIIARLLQELLADEEDEDIRPASEMHWNTPSSWTLPPRIRDLRHAKDAPAPITPTLDAEASAAAAAARDRKPRSEPPATAAKPPAPEPDASERVSWQAATDAAWLAPRETSSPSPQPAQPAEPNKPEQPAKPANESDDEDDFTPLKFD